MSVSTENRFDRNDGQLVAEEILRVIATMPAPEGLEDRVKARLRVSPGRATVIAWPFSSAESWMRSAGMRAAAAAAIVMVIAGGGWGVYSHIQVAPVPTAAVDQQTPNDAGRFSTAGAKHVPQTVEGPVVVAPVIEKQMQETGKAQVPQKHAATKGKHQKQAVPAAEPRR
jgi:hypothetical protein